MRFEEDWVRSNVCYVGLLMDLGLLGVGDTDLPQVTYLSAVASVEKLLTRTSPR